MASSTWWTWVWANSKSWWWTGKPGILQSMGSQRIRHDWTTEVIRTGKCHVKTQGEWCDNRGQNWSDVASSQGTPRIDSHHQKLVREKNSLQSQRETGPVTTLISDFHCAELRQDCETQFVGLCYNSFRKQIQYFRYSNCGCYYYFLLHVFKLFILYWVIAD